MRRLQNIINPMRVARYIADIRRNAVAVSRQYGIPVSTIVREQVRLNMQKGLRRDEYYKYHLFDPALSWEEKCAFASDAEIKPILRALNPPAYYNLFKNKLMLKRFFCDAGVPMASLLGVYDPVWGKMEKSTTENTDGTEGDGRGLRRAEDLQRLIDGLADGEGVVFKPIEGSEGQMVMVFPTTESTEDTERERAKERVGSEENVGSSRHSPQKCLVSVSGERVTVDVLAARLSDRDALSRAYCGGEIKTAFVVESYVRGHRELADLCGETLCTCRVVTLVRGEGEGNHGKHGMHGKGQDEEISGQKGTKEFRCGEADVEILGAVFKLAPSAAGVDNLHAGGMSVGIDLETGVLQKGRTMADMWRPYRSELENGVRFEGRQLPFWKEVVAVAKQAALAFPLLPCVGWDIAITDDGPIVIEGNWGWAADLVQIGMHRGVLTEGLLREVERVNHGNHGRHGKG